MIPLNANTASHLVHAPPLPHAAFKLQERFYGPKAGHNSGVVSASPQHLRTFAQQASSLNRNFEIDLLRLRSAWSRFCNECSWMAAETETLFAGYNRFIALVGREIVWISITAERFPCGVAPIWEWFDSRFGIASSDSLPGGWDWGVWGASHTISTTSVTHRSWEPKLTRAVPLVGWLPKVMPGVAKREPFYNTTTKFNDWGARNFGHFAPRGNGSKSLMARFFYNFGQNRVPRPFKAQLLTHWGKSAEY